jgi:hypothetical protein
MSETRKKIELWFDHFGHVICRHRWIAIGPAVDDTIHFINNFRRYYYESGEVRRPGSRWERLAAEAELR